MIELVEDKLDIDTYLELRQSVNFRKLTRDQAKKGLRDFEEICHSGRLRRNNNDVRPDVR